MSSRNLTVLPKRLKKLASARHLQNHRLALLNSATPGLPMLGDLSSLPLTPGATTLTMPAFSTHMSALPGYPQAAVRGKLSGVSGHQARIENEVSLEGRVHDVGGHKNVQKTFTKGNGIPSVLVRVRQKIEPMAHVITEAEKFHDSQL